MFPSSEVDDEQSNTLKAYERLGSPAYPKPAQVEQMNRESAPAPPEHRSLTNGKLTLELRKNALVLIKVGP